MLTMIKWASPFSHLKMFCDPLNFPLDMLIDGTIKNKHWLSHHSGLGQQHPDVRKGGIKQMQLNLLLLFVLWVKNEV